MASVFAGFTAKFGLFTRASCNGLQFQHYRNISQTVQSSMKIFGIPKPLFGIGSGSEISSSVKSTNLLADVILPGIFQVRTHVRDYFPRPSEIKRIRVHGWKARMSTMAGRRVIMRRILKKRHVLSH